MGRNLNYFVDDLVKHKTVVIIAIGVIVTFRLLEYRVSAEEKAHAATVAKMDSAYKELAYIDKRVVATETNIGNMANNIEKINEKLDRVVTKEDLRTFANMISSRRNGDGR